MDLSTQLMLATSSALLFLAVALGVTRIAPLWDVVATRQMGELAVRFERLSLDQEQLRFFLRVWGVALVGVFFFFWLSLHMFPLACAFTGLVYMAPRHVLDWLIRRRSRLLRDQMVGAAMALANAVKAGLSLAQGLESVARETPQPLAAELRRIVFDYQRGRPLKEAIESVRTRLCLEEFTLFALAVEVALDRGGRINEALARISESLREKQRLERKLRATTAAGRQVVVILAFAPLLFLAMSFASDARSARLLFSTLGGQLVLVVVVLLVYAGCYWAWKIAKTDF